MKVTELASGASAKVQMSFSMGQPVRICDGMLAGYSGTLAGLTASGRAAIQLQPDVYLEIDQSCLEWENAE